MIDLKVLREDPDRVRASQRARGADEDAVDEIHVFVAPKVIGGAAAKSPVGGRGWESIAESSRWSMEHFEYVDGDIYLRCVKKCENSKSS